MSNNVIQLVHSAGEARVDSRLIAEGLGIKHKYSFALIQKYASRFEELSSLPFQKEARARRAGGGVVERFALLNEDQAYFLLSLSRNSDRVVDLKLRLVKAFRDARNQAGLDNVMGMILLTAPAPWEKRFGDDYYRALARITGTVFEGHAKGTPAIFGQITDRWVYAAILPKEVHAELKARRSESERMHQWLTDGGRDRLDQQIRMVTLIADSSVDRKDFEARCMQTFGLPGQLRLIYPQAA
ncbi:P63C domain-containing protein [Pseudomonas aeruginosa]|uniref:P63C domain-containing protein n=1 Tax=Pseudomonas aeruginosa TaxID=287 RepID=UPI00227B24AA|nr:P63C domain-containing protein [Pseudomonas aeruginosa]WAJ75225.1 P63C domain-containing protein [Pseudomonas aeruginosa]